MRYLDITPELLQLEFFKTHLVLTFRGRSKAVSGPKFLILPNFGNF